MPSVRRVRGAALALAAAVAAAGCGVLPRKVALRYAPSKNVERRARQTVIVLKPVLDKRADMSSIGRAPLAAGIGSVALKPRGDLAAWVREAARAELEAAGYRVLPDGSDYKLGGAVKAVSCGGAKRMVCSVRVEMWIRMKDDWQLLTREYEGEGARPPLFAGEDPYELSMEEALREALSGLRRDIERLVP